MKNVHIYGGQCPACKGLIGAYVQYVVEDKSILVIPSPTIKAICQCFIPVTEFDLIYQGSQKN